jgi:divalent metal cation (Fe/Co/Zn/Cd) transporter
VRKSGLEYFVDIHIEVAPDLTVEVGHQIAHAVKDRIRENVAAIRDVLVHVEPHSRSIASPPARMRDAEVDEVAMTLQPLHLPQPRPHQ